MSFTPILIPQDFANKGAMSLPNQPTIPAESLKARFDSPSREVCAPAFNRLIGELEAESGAQTLGATAPQGRGNSKTVQGVMNKLSEDLATVESSIETVVAHDHTHTNKSVLDDLSDDNGTLKYKNESIGEKDYSNLENKPSINSHTLKGNQTASDLGLMPEMTLATVATSGSYNDLSDRPTIPVVDVTYNASSDNAQSGKGVASAVATKSTVVWNQSVLTGQKIATISIDGTPTDVYAPTGGTPGTGAVDSVNNQTGEVHLDIGDMEDATFSGMAENDAIVRNGSNKWVNVPLPTVALTGSYGDLSGKPNLATVATSGSYNDLSNKPSLATVATSGAYSDLSGKPTIPADLDDLSDVTISSPANDQVIKYSNGTWVNGAAPASGHTMLPTPSGSVDESAIVGAVNTALVEGGTNDDVGSLNTIGTWSNTVSRDYMVQATAEHPIGTSGFGDWEDESTMDGWIAIADLYNISAKEYTIEPIYDPTSFSGVQPVFRGYKIEDNTTATIGGQTVNCGKICMLFANEIDSADTETARVGIRITISRTPISYITP